MKFLKVINSKKNNLFRKIKKLLLVSFIKTRKAHRHFDPDEVRSILLLRLDDKIGDMVVTTGTASILAERGYRVSVLTGPICCQMLGNCTYLEQVIPYRNRMSLAEIKALKFDVVIDFDDVEDYERLNLAWRLKNSHHIGFNKKLPAIYNPSISFLNSEQHITERHKQVLALFNIHKDVFEYRLGFCSDEKNKVINTLSFIQGDTIVSINPFSGAQDKDFSKEQVISLIRFIHTLDPMIKVVIIGQTSKIQLFSKYGAYIVPESTINTAIEIVRISDVVVSTDTSIVHIANALNRPLVSVYNRRALKDTGLLGYKIWAPNYALGRQIVVEDSHISSCSLNLIFPEVEGAVRAVKSQLT